MLKFTPALDKTFRQRKRAVGTSWRLDETYIRVKGQWKYLYRAVDKAGHTVDFLLTAKRDRKAALRFLRQAIDQSGLPEKITIDKSGANTAAIDDYNTDHETDIELRQAKYLNNIVEQDHRAIKRQTRPMLGFKSFWSAAITVPQRSIEGQWKITSGATILFVNYVEQFNINDRPRPLGNFATEPKKTPGVTRRSVHACFVARPLRFRSRSCWWTCRTHHRHWYPRRSEHLCLTTQ